MNRRISALLTLALGLVLAGNTLAAEKKTDPARDVFVENSTTDFTLTAKPARVSGKNKVAFDLSAPDPGDYTLACFIDGKPWKQVKFKSPGTFELNTRGIAPASYRITLQLIDSRGRVGSVTQIIELK